MRILHLYGQGAWHDDVWIVGDHEALVELMATIQRARNMGEGVCEASVNDGEGFRRVPAGRDPGIVLAVFRSDGYGAGGRPPDAQMAVGVAGGEA